VTSTLVDEYVKTLAPAGYDRSTVAERRQEMEKALSNSTLDADYWFESGSWSHGTALKGHSDVDFMAWASGTRPQRPSTALSTLKTALSGSYWAITGLRVSSPTVKVQFLTAPHFEVVPAWQDRRRRPCVLDPRPRRSVDAVGAACPPALRQ
jgi:tRNA nucleotidyltransferase (CCA-adding enzyme)